MDRVEGLASVNRSNRDIKAIIEKMTKKLTKVDMCREKNTGPVFFSRSDPCLYYRQGSEQIDRATNKIRNQLERNNQPLGLDKSNANFFIPKREAYYYSERYGRRRDNRTFSTRINKQDQPQNNRGSSKLRGGPNYCYSLGSERN
jgi:hypothetical protein